MHSKKLQSKLMHTCVADPELFIIVCQLGAFHIVHYTLVSNLPVLPTNCPYTLKRNTHDHLQIYRKIYKLTNLGIGISFFFFLLMWNSNEKLTNTFSLYALLLTVNGFIFTKYRIEGIVASIYNHLVNYIFRKD